MNKVVRLRRLNHLIETLKNVPKGRFYMDAWTMKDGSISKAECKIGLTCGAAACALGWEASTKYARKAGLKLVMNEGWNSIIPVYKDKENYDAGAEFFGILLDEAEYLFDPYSYKKIFSNRKIRPSEVIKRVQKLIKKYKLNRR